MYWVVLVADLAFIYWPMPEARWLTKPMLMPLLIGAYLKHPATHPQASFTATMVAALFFSWVGDVLLQFKGLFIYGLVSFLIAHLFYTTYFLKAGKEKKGLLQFQPLIGLPVLVYLLVFLMLLYPFLDKLKLPVTIYSMVIVTMLLSSINLRNRIGHDASALFFHGALQFVISDSLLAVHLFAFPHTILSICVMLTYASAQYLLVKASLLHLSEYGKQL